MHNLANNILKNNIGLICIIILLGFAAHACMLSATFKTLDDSYSIINNPDIKEFANIDKIFKSSFFGSKHYYRPLVSLSFLVEHYFFGLRSFFYNLTNLIFHLTIAVTVFFLILHILGDRASAFFTSLLFAVHPIQWEAVANIPGRAVILSTFFTVNAFLLYCLFQNKQRSVRYYVLSLIFFVCGLLSKESAAMLPILILSHILLIEKDNKKYSVVLPYFIIIAVYMVIRYLLGIAEIFPWRSASELMLGFLTFLRACLTYLRLIVWPVDLHFDRATEMFLSFNDFQLWVTIFVYLAIGLVLWTSRKRLTRPIIFFITWVCIELFPVSQIITTIGVRPGYISTAEHFLYMPAIGLFVLLVLGLKQLYRLNYERGYCSVHIVQFVCAGSILFLILITAQQSIHARTSATMFRRTIAYNPNNTRILYSLGIEMVNQQRFVPAEKYFRQVLSGEPRHLMARISLARALHDQGKFIEAIGVYETMQDVGPWEDLVKENQNEAYQMAVEQYTQRIVKEPDNAQLYYSLGTVYSRSDHIEEGIQQYKKAVSLDPVYKNALFNLASSYEALGENGWAAVYYERMLAIGEDIDELDKHAYKRLVEIYKRQGDTFKVNEYINKESDI